MISTHPPIATKSRFCRSFIRYLGRLDPGYSQHLGLSTIELSKVHSLLPLVLTRFWLTQTTQVQLELARRRTALGELDRDQLVAQVNLFPSN